MWKYTVINFLIGAAIALILSTLLVLGLRIFVGPIPVAPPSPDYSSCATGDQACLDRQLREYREADDAYLEKRNIYGGKAFIAANAAGIALLLFGIGCFWLGLGTNIGAGLITSGIFGILYGYIQGWGGTDDVIKFGVGALAALIVIGGGIFLNRLRVKGNANFIRR